ncbi:MAG: polyphosphate kinase 2 family protein [Gemmatimonadales bacterium]|nr:polyphosphate kinase 2 family protein [Gemmatimonadales bacterium]
MRLPPVPPGTLLALSDADAKLPAGQIPAKSELREELDRLTERIDARQRALHAEGTRALLVVLQGRDASGKDGTIRKVFGPLDPLGVTATSFKVPSEWELRHDFLWRVHAAAPPRGSIGIFNRSHYEDVLVVRVRRLASETVWRPRFEQINDFERILIENGTVILKFMLHISREEQRERLQARLEDSEKYWKFNAGDLKERDLWAEYTEAYQETLALTSTALAPWYVVPADEKRVRDVLVARTVAETLERMDPRYPGPPPELEALRKAVAK